MGSLFYPPDRLKLSVRQGASLRGTGKLQNGERRWIDLPADRRIPAVRLSHQKEQKAVVCLEIEMQESRAGEHLCSGIYRAVMMQDKILDARVTLEDR